MRAVFDRKLLILSVAALILLVIFSAVTAVSYGITHTSALETQYVKDEWQTDNGMRYALISLFIDPDANFEYSSVLQLRTSLETKLQEESVQSMSDNSDARLYVDAYSTEKTLSVTSDRASVSNADAFLVGGDFFLIHKLPLVSGGYFSDDEPGTYLAVIDTVMAWQLFGSPDVIGMQLYIDDVPYTVSGVVEPQSGVGYDELYGTTPKIYINYASISDKYEALPIECVELIAPDPVSGYALDKVKSVSGVDESMAKYVDNTSRFNVLTLYGQLGGFAERSIKSSRITYPIWENVALIASDIACLLLLLQSFLLGAAIILLVIAAVILYIRISRYLREEKNEIGDSIDKKFDAIRARVSGHRKKRGENHDQPIE